SVARTRSVPRQRPSVLAGMRWNGGGAGRIAAHAIGLRSENAPSITVSTFDMAAIAWAPKAIASIFSRLVIQVSVGDLHSGQRDAPDLPLFVQSARSETSPVRGRGLPEGRWRGRAGLRCASRR